MRAQLARPDQNLLTPEAYNQIFTMHGVTMIFWYASPILSGFGNYLVPLMIGARDMAFRRLNAFTYWVFLLSGLFLYASLGIGQAPHAGWFAYVPYTDERFSPGLNLHFYALALLLLTISTTTASINFMVSILPAARAGDDREPHAPAHVQHADVVVFHRLLPAGADRCLRLLRARPAVGDAVL